jgi:hypothetical protein
LNVLADLRRHDEVLRGGRERVRRFFPIDDVAQICFFNEKMKSKLLVLTALSVLTACNSSKKDTGGLAGSAGLSGSGASSSGGASGISGSSGTGGTAGSSQAGTAGGASAIEAQNLKFLQGPVADDQHPLLVGLDHAVRVIDDSSLLINNTGDLFAVVTEAGTPVIAKYDSSLTKTWSYSVFDNTFKLSNTNISFSEQNTDGNTLSVAADGGLFFGGRIASALPGESYGGAEDSFVGKIAADGTLAWIHQLGSSSSDFVHRTFGLPDGSVIAIGETSGQLPGQPDTVLGGTYGSDWLVRYEADGTQTWLKQYTVDPAGSIPGGLFGTDADGRQDTEMALDPSGVLLVADGPSVTKIDVAHGTVLDSRLVVNDNVATTAQTPNGNLVNCVPIGMTSDGFYTWTDYVNRDSAKNPKSSAALAKFSLDGVVLSYREVEPVRTAVIDPVGNVTWSGTMNALNPGLSTNRYIAVSSDAVYLAGIYENSYSIDGAAARPTIRNLFVGKYSLTGDRIWFQELSFAGDTADDMIRSLPRGLQLDLSGNPVLLAVQKSFDNNNHDLLLNPTGGFIFKLNAADGTVM